MTPAELAAIRERADAATEGPWEAEHRESLDWLSQGLGDDSHQPGSTVHNGDPGNPLFGTLWPNRNGRENAEFIAHARTDVPALLDHVVRLEQRVRARDITIQTLSSNHASRVEAIRELHRKGSRYGDEEFSVPADEYLETPDDYPGFEPFDVCEHCMDIEVSIQGDDVHWIGIGSSWPCPTIQALEGDQ